MDYRRFSPNDTIYDMGKKLPFILFCLLKEATFDLLCRISCVYTKILVYMDSGAFYSEIGRSKHVLLWVFYSGRVYYSTVILQHLLHQLSRCNLSGSIRH